VHFTSRNHGGDAAVKTTIDPANLILAWGPITGDRVDVTVNQARSKCRAVGVDEVRCALGVDILLPADYGDAAVYDYDSVSIEDRVSEIAAEDESNIANDEFGAKGRLPRVLMSHGFSSEPEPTQESKKHFRDLSFYTKSHRSAMDFFFEGDGFARSTRQTAKRA
jgi:hypothetical protein